MIYHTFLKIILFFSLINELFHLIMIFQLYRFDVENVLMSNQDKLRYQHQESINILYTLNVLIFYASSIYGDLKHPFIIFNIYIYIYVI